MKCSIKKRELPPAPKITTKTVRNDTMRGYGAYTYESPFPQTVMDLRIPPTRSNSKHAEAEREAKIILDLAREGKTASEIEAETGFPRRRVTLTVMKFAEYGAKLTPEPKRKKRIDKRKLTMWTDEMEEQLIALHHEGLTFAQIAEEIGVSKGAISSKVRSLVEAEVLKPRMQEIMWTKEEIDKMFQMRAEGKMWGEIADKLGRKITACHNAYSRERERREKKCQKG